MSVYCTERPPNFTYDVAVYGGIPERFFYSYYEPKFRNLGWTIKDVTKDRYWQQYDTDFVVATDGGMIENNVDDPRYVKIEVKSDLKCHKTGNLAYEVRSHGKPGWVLKTKADLVMIFDCEDDNQDGTLKANRCYIIKMKRWYEYAAWFKNSPEFKTNSIEAEDIFDHLHKIEELRRFGIIEKEYDMGGMRI